MLYLIAEGFASIFSHGFMSFASVTIIIACLIIMGSFSLLSVNIDAVIKTAENENEILAYVDEYLPDEEVLALKERIEAIDGVTEAVFVTREEAFERFAEKHGDTELFSDLAPEVLRHRYVVYMEDITMMEPIQREIRRIEGLPKVNASLEIARGFMAARRIVNLVSIVLVVILVTVSVFIMANTIKLTTFGRREEIAVMKMVGATNSFIRLPFVVEGVALGAVGSGLAFLIQWAIYLFVQSKVVASTAVSSFMTMVPFETVMYPMLFVFLGIGTFVGLFGGVVAIRNYLKV